MEEYNINEKICCPRCGSKHLQITTETNVHTSGKNYSGAQGCLGALMFGPMGLLCGSCGRGQKTTVTNTRYWVCFDCGNKFKNPNDIREQLEKTKKAISAPIFIIQLLLCIFFVVLGSIIELEVFKWFGIVMGILSILLFIIGNAITVPKLQNELDEIENNMRKFTR